MSDKKKNETRSGNLPERIKVEIEVLNGHWQLLQKVYEERALRGDDPSCVNASMIWEEACRTFDGDQPMQIINNFYLDRSPS